ncbi:hypothetical protein [Caldivirga maquilingensis]|uniref:hypothetical protein n=1 Tax=Caldivirga maquilingensis TaxID=76887 RepID=UPI000B202426|nr:hypothetical protein [Caldivirga maquilingensis]
MPANQEIPKPNKPQYPRVIKPWPFIRISLAHVKNQHPEALRASAIAINPHLITNPLNVI